MGKKIISVSFLLFFLCLTLSCDRGISLPPGAETITIKDLKRDMAALASPETEGRMTASPGYLRAADYTIERFEKYGLKPGWKSGSAEASFLQPVPFLRYHYGSENTLVVEENGRSEALPAGGDNFELYYPGMGGEKVMAQNPVFIGYGIHEPELGWDDFAGFDIEGKVVIMMAGLPAENNRIPGMPRSVIEKYSRDADGDYRRLLNLINRKAALIIGLPDQALVDRWKSVMGRSRRSSLVPAEDYLRSAPGEPPMPVLIAHEDLAKRLFRNRGFNPVTGIGEYRTFTLDDVKLSININVEKEPVSCFNVIAECPGTDPGLSGQVITVSAHLDHLGRIADTVYNGANDDASGCVSILEVAEAIAADPLPRPVLFVLFTAEELGHFGSLHFCAHPPVPLDRMLINVNIEQIGARTRYVRGVWAIGPPSQKEVVKEAGKGIGGLKLRFDDIENFISAIQGSDTWSFYQFKAPAIILGSGGFPEHHTDRDNVDLIDFDHLRKATVMLLSYIRRLGTSSR